LKPLTLETLADLRAGLDSYRRADQRIGLVPTMGNLHAGHLALVEELGRHCDRVVVSLFVNPTQFGPNEDYQRYPRTVEADLHRLAEVGCDRVWLPDVGTMYPLAEPFMLRPPPSLADTLCGQYRPGHFEGVASVVLRLFNQVQPDVAVFGEKDFQQLLVIQQMVRDLALPIQIIGLATVREADGLAMSSRNQYLSPAERAVAPRLHEVLRESAASLKQGLPWEEIRENGWQRLSEAGFEPQYLEWRSAEDLGPPVPGRPQRLLAAAILGKARLIDNLERE
jgi:pantoate--beta-alanine ligase